MTKFVPKEVLGDSTFVAVYDPRAETLDMFEWGTL